MIGRLIDDESRGDTVLMQSLAYADQIARAAAARNIRLIVVAAPRETWAREDELCLRFLAAAGTCEVMVATIEANSDDALGLDPAGGFVTGDDWDRALARLHGAPARDDVPLLQRQAAAAFHRGSLDVALRYIAAAEERAGDPIAAAAVRAARQGMLIARLRFREAVAIRLPDVDLPGELRAALALGKAWALVMCDRASEAEALFAEVREAFGRYRESREYLYVLNIWALNRLKLGDTEGALALEKSIESTLARLPRRDDHLLYINAINQARLYRQRRDAAMAMRYYDLAFGTTYGARSDSDLVYTNICCAAVLAASGSALDAFHARFRAALHWAASRVPEALAPRTVRALLSGDRTGTEDLVEHISGRLEIDLRAAAAAAGIAIPAAAHDCVPAFVPLAEIADIPTVAVGAPGWSVFAANAAADPPFRGPRYDSLLRCLGDTIVALSTPQWRLPLYAVDARNGREVPLTFEELFTRAIMVDCRAVEYGDSRTILAGHVRARLRAALRTARPHLVAAVDDVDGQPRVRFRRYLPPVTLRRELAPFVEPCRSIAELAAATGRSAEETFAVAAALEELRVIDLSLAAADVDSARRSRSATGAPCRRWRPR
jgi:hypothetical protein